MHFACKSVNSLFRNRENENEDTIGPKKSKETIEFQLNRKTPTAPKVWKNILKLSVKLALTRLKSLIPTSWAE